MKKPVNRDRSFGISVGVVLLAIAAVLWWRGRVGRAEVVGGDRRLAPHRRPRLRAAAEVSERRVVAVLDGARLRQRAHPADDPVLARARAARRCVWRLIGKDPLARRRRTWPGWSPYPARYRDREALRTHVLRSS